MINRYEINTVPRNQSAAFLAVLRQNPAAESNQLWGPVDNAKSSRPLEAEVIGGLSSQSRIKLKKQLNDSAYGKHNPNSERSDFTSPQWLQSVEKCSSPEKRGRNGDVYKTAGPGTADNHYAKRGRQQLADIRSGQND